MTHQNTALLNPTPDSAAADEMLAAAKSELERAEKVLTHSRLTPHDYEAAFARAQTSRAILKTLTDIYGKRFKV